MITSEEIWRGALAFMLGFALATTVKVTQAPARDVDGRYAASPLKPFFDSLKSSGGDPCCSDADGSAVSDVDWESTGGHYRVRIQGQWWDVPEKAVVTAPNLAGRAMVWPVYYNSRDEPVRINIRCFMPGSMS